MIFGTIVTVAIPEAFSSRAMLFIGETVRGMPIVADTDWIHMEVKPEYVTATKFVDPERALTYRKRCDRENIIAFKEPV